MPLLFTDTEGRKYLIEDPEHAELIVNLARRKAQLEGEVFTLEMRQKVLETKLRRAKCEHDEVVNAAIADLDPDRQ